MNKENNKTKNYKEGILIDVYYKDENLYCTIKKDSKKEDFVCNFYSYFYISFSKELDKEHIKFIKDNLDIRNITKVNKENISNIYKLDFNNIEDLLKTRKLLINKEIDLSLNYKLHEFDIPFVYRYFVDHKISSFINIKYLLDKDKRIIDIKDNGRIKLDDLNQGCFDIEVLLSNKLSFPKPGQDPIISISYINNNSKKYNFFLVKEEDLKDKEKENISKKIKEELKDVEVNLFTTEKELIESFIDLVKKEDPDILYTYNGVFDFTYLSKAYKKICNKNLNIGNRKIVFSKRGRQRASIQGIVHFDVYLLMRLLNYFQVFNYPKLDLNSLYYNLTSNKKLVLEPKDMIESYNSKNYSTIIKYNLDDCFATIELANLYIGFVYEMSYFLSASINDVLYSSASMMVEKLFIKDYNKNNKIIPNKPNRNQIQSRYKHKFKGSFVYQPKAGLYKDVAIVDFRSYHISLLISYNISPETIDNNYNNYNNYNKDNEQYTILDHKISKKPKGFVPSLLENLLDLRMHFKDLMKKEKKHSSKYNSLYSKQYAIKILLASTYGYLGYVMSRWYCASCLDVMYYLVRRKIKKLINDFEDLDYEVVYGDTDSCFLKFKDLEKLKKDLEKINSSLPEGMFLELEDVFKTAIFVKSRGKNKAAKKKYAMLDYNGELKIKGFEYVRRDWCDLVKNTQKKVLEILLKKQDSKQAISYIRDVILKLQNKKVPKKDLIIRSFIHKNINKYKSKNPAASAYVDAKEKGIELSNNDLIEYIITNKNTKTISSKARVVQFVESGDYDSTYYINNQLIPAISTILEVFGISKDELITQTKQKNLKDYFS